MSDYISREAVLMQLCNRHCATDPAECLFKITHNGDPGCFTADDILKIPAADVRPVKRGEWNTASLDHEAFGVRPKVLYCSECYTVVPYKTNFCPNCGAMMGGMP